MSKSRPDGRFERIVVACDPTPPGAAALEAAAALAASLQAELAGLFVEDINLLRLAALPFTRELGLTSAVIRPIDTPDIEREFKLHADRVRKALERAANASRVRWSFQIIRGQPLATALSARGDTDLLVVGGVVRSAGRLARPEKSADPATETASRRAGRGPRAHPVAVLYDGSPRAERALEVAAALATGSGRPLAIWVPADREEQFKDLQEQVRAWLARRDGAAKILWLRGCDPRTLAQAVGVEAPAALLWHEPLDSQQLEVLLEALQCPLVLLA